jgi:hypothetical protein
MTIRTYALYGRSKHLLAWLIIVLVALAGAASVRVHIPFCTWMYEFFLGGNVWTVFRQYDHLARNWLLRNIYSRDVNHFF